MVVNTLLKTIYIFFNQLLKMGDMEKVLALIPNALRKGGALSYSHLSPPTKIHKNQQKPKSYNRNY
jgi:hypothetical protein